MAIIKCIECGNEVSDKAKSCPKCGFPIEKLKKDGIVKIKMPPTPATGLIALMMSTSCQIKTIGTNKILWAGKYTQVAEFYLQEPVDVIITFGSMSNPLKATIEPNTRYNITQDIGMHWNATYVISKVEMIDAD